VAVKKSSGKDKPAYIKQHMRTSIGQSVNSSPKNKSKRRSFKRYRGQGK
jgi:hypothetical protein|tara:strand:- start:2678 stop:2824 length:147 start_codon:yes stop_codon:yes gene_type:complete